VKFIRSPNSTTAPRIEVGFKGSSRVKAGNWPRRAWYVVPDLTSRVEQKADVETLEELIRT
jgi:hypothetical protein